MSRRFIDTVIEDQAEGPKPADPAPSTEPPAGKIALSISVDEEVAADLKAAGVPLPSGAVIEDAPPPRRRRAAQTEE